MDGKLMNPALNFILSLALLMLPLHPQGRTQAIISPAPTASGGAITLLTHTQCAGDSTCTTPAIDTTGATLLIVGACAYGGQTMSGYVSDSKSNSWQARTWNNLTGGTSQEQIFYVYSPTVGTGHTFTINPAANWYMSITAAAFSGTLTTSGVYDTESAGGSSANNVVQPGSLTPSQVGELLFTEDCTSGTVTDISINSSFTIIEKQLTSNEEKGGSAYWITNQSGTGVNPTWTSTTGSTSAAGMASFKHP